LSRFRKDEEHKIFLFERLPYATSRIIAAAVADAACRPFQDDCPRACASSDTIFIARLRRRRPGRTANSSGSDALTLRRYRLAALASTLSANDIRRRRSNGQCRSGSEVICPYVKQVAIANPKQVRIIACEIKTDTIDVEAFELRRQLTRLRAHLFASHRQQSALRLAYFPLWTRTSPPCGKHALALKLMEARAGYCATSRAVENGATMRASVVLGG
jgi:hypothetical protein